jgi:predicted RNase H-like nuclease
LAAGEGISQRAFALRHKIGQVDRWIRQTDHRVVEVHPELAFARVAGKALPYSKSTWHGAAHRSQLLAAARIWLAAAAWTALRVAQGQTRPMPDPPESFSDGLPAAIWN